MLCAYTQISDHTLFLELHRQLDQVMLLAEGHAMYYGDALRAAGII